MQCPLKDTRCRRCGELLSVSIPHAQGASAPLPFAQESLKSHIGNYTGAPSGEPQKHVYHRER